ncbi:MAG: alpha-1,2-fucosyltransferase [Bacteroidales bacterium]|nr:alpha-1,2-fucosyltransferase [Bacteroidales bacterium]MCM1414575.1 alpha-1,2-fucosyltransferase [bacterium]MCM1422625.1 alpha-1,2-fucosyltransferase [bacterium]
MVIIQLAGGLGNQMFQYALYLQLKSLGREVRIEDVSGFAQDAQRKPALAPFGIAYERPGRKELEQMLDSSMLPWQRVRRKLFGRHKKSYFEESKLFIPEVMTWDDIYLEGYWQSEKYFRDAASAVRQAYDTDRLIDWLRREGFWDKEGGGDGARAEEMSAAQYLQEINNTCSVSIHVRRGDYLTPENQALFGGICTEAYYIEGIRRMREKYPDCRFFLFTNDGAWAAGRLAEERKKQAEAQETGESLLSDITLVDLPQGDDDGCAAFALMSRCKHQILANSSFSWWASYLNPNPEKTVLAPPCWLNDTDCRDFYRADMQKICLSSQHECADV